MTNIGLAAYVVSAIIEFSVAENGQEVVDRCTVLEVASGIIAVAGN